MKVLVISHMYPSTYDEIGAPFVHDQVKELARQGLEVKVVSPNPWAPFPINRMSKKWRAYSEIPYRQIRDGIEVFYPKYVELPKAYLGSYSGESMYLGVRTLFDNIYNNFKFDLIHAHTAYPDGFAGLRLKMKYKIPLVVTIHGLDVCSSAPHKPTIERSKRLRKSVLQVFRGSDKIAGVSSMVSNIIMRYFPNPQKVTFVNNGIPIDKVKHKIPCEAGSKIKIISVGYLEERKGHEFVIRSLPDLIKDGIELEYIIVGDGENRRFLEGLVKEMGLENIVRFLGMKTQDGVFKALAEADIFCLPSWDEAFGVVYLEAMAVGLPVIGCKGQGIKDVIEDGHDGVLVEPKDVSSVESALKRLLTNPFLCREMGKRARGKVLNNFTWAKNAEKYFELYKGVLN